MKIVLIVILGIFAVCLAVYAYFGGFKKLNVSVAEQGGETVVYESITGDYRQSGEVMNKIYYSLLNDYKIETFKGFGQYFDNPQKVEKAKLRSEAGCIIETVDLDKIANLPESFKTKVLPTQRYIITEFPYKGKLSIIFSVMKAYPALAKYATENNFNGEGSVIEIYDMPNKKIYYRKEIVE